MIWKIETFLFHSWDSEKRGSVGLGEGGEQGVDPNTFAIGHECVFLCLTNFSEGSRSLKIFIVVIFDYLSLLVQNIKNDY